MFRLLGIVVVGAACVIGASYANTWFGVAVAVIAVGGLVWWLMQEPVPGAADPPPKLESHTPAGVHRVLLVATPGTRSVPAPDGASEVVVLVPALASTAEALTGAVDDRRAEAQQTADALARSLPNARAEVGADDPVLAVEDALRTFGADEVLVVGGEDVAERIRARVTVPVSRA